MDAAHERLTVVVADANVRFRRTLAAALEPEGFDLVAEIDDASAVVAAVEELKPDFLLVDAALPGKGLAAVARVARRFPATTVVMMGVSPDPAVAVSALERGAAGYLSKWLRTAELAKTLRAARLGEPAVSRAMLPAVIGRVRGRIPRSVELGGSAVELTLREREVAELLRDGVGTSEIADRLGLSPVTVRRHVSSLLRKLGVTDRDAAIRLLAAPH